MSVTTKAARRAGGCVCSQNWKKLKGLDYTETTCKPGYCFSAKCLTCGGEVFGMGPMACPCEAPRWFRHPDMARRGYFDLDKNEFVESRGVAVKPNIARRNRGKRLCCARPQPHVPQVRPDRWSTHSRMSSGRSLEKQVASTRGRGVGWGHEFKDSHQPATVLQARDARF
jgi:hypothetical protein